MADQEPIAHAPKAHWARVVHYTQDDPERDGWGIECQTCDYGCGPFRTFDEADGFARQHEQLASRQHVVTLLLEEGSVYPTIECPHDRADESRPCWPHHENGERFSAEDGARDGCVYRDWLEEVGGEALAHPTTVRFVLREAAWRGDHFDFYLGEQVTE